MGSSQSTVETEHLEHRLIQRLHNTHLREDLSQQELDTDYVEISNEKQREIPSYRASPTVSISQTAEWEKKLLASSKNRLALTALLSNDVDSVVRSVPACIADPQLFNVKIPLEGTPITNQRASGRCWLFATTNVHRVAIMRKHNLAAFELSQAYLFFWDKIEKANWFLEQILDTSDEVLDSRLVQQLLAAPVNDGGQWDMANNLIYKYGLVPHNLYPDSANAMNSGKMDRALTSKLRADGLKLRAMAASMKSSEKSSDKEKLLIAKNKMMQEIYCIVTLMLGPPPKPDESFKWEYYDANGKYHCVSKTPLELAHELHSQSNVRTLGINVNNLFSLVNDPRAKYLTHLTVDRLGNVVNGHSPITYINVDMPTMKRAAIRMLKAGYPVFFGSDVGKFSDSLAGIMDTKLFDYNLVFGCGNGSLQMSKADRLRVGESAMTHAMVLTAVQVDEKTGRSIRWRVQNSWGALPGDQGFFVMTDEWMDEFCYQVVVDPSFVAKEVSDCLKQKPVVLPLWDPLGALA